MWWEQMDFAVQAPGEWRRVLDTSEEVGFVRPLPVGDHVSVGPRSIVALTL